MSDDYGDLAEIFNAYPEAAPFADLFTTDDFDQAAELAADIAARVRSAVAGRPETGQEEGGCSGRAPEPSARQERPEKALSVAEALEAKDLGAFLRAKSAAAGLPAPEAAEHRPRRLYQPPQSPSGHKAGTVEDALARGDLGAYITAATRRAHEEDNDR